MSSEDNLHASGHSDSGSPEKKLQNSSTEPSPSNPQPDCSQLKDTIISKENLGVDGDSEHADGHLVQEMELDKEFVPNPPIAPILQGCVGLSETVTMVEKTEVVQFGVNGENGCEITQGKSTISNHRIDDSPTSGVKRARTTYVSQEPSVHVVYKFLTRASKRKLEELLQQWSEWHARHSLSTNDSDLTLECGEETFFPALHVGQEKTSTVSFWMEEQTSKETTTFIALDGDSVPLYDREFAVGLTSADGSTNLEGKTEQVDASRCFNCGSYGHSLKECPKPRDHAAVNNARKQHNSKKNLSSGPRNPARYYQDSNGGKYGGLKPGVLGSETRQLLGLTELDPPPWLNRMRQIGYPIAYLELEDEDQPSGITIFADEENEEEQKEEREYGEEDGEILEKSIPEPKKKMTVEFPGINAPIPENADQRRWASPENSGFDPSRKRLQSMSPSGHYSDQRWSVDYRGDGPPGCSPGHDPAVSTYSPRHGAYDSNIANESQSPRLNPIPRSPSLGRSFSDRDRRSPLIYEGSPNHSRHNSLQYLSQSQSYGSPSFERWNHSSHHHDSNHDFSSQRKDRHDRHHHQRRK